MADLPADIEVIWPRGAWVGWDQVQAGLDKHFSETEHMRVYLYRLLIDVEQAVAALEWIYRYVEPNTNVFSQIK